MTRHSLVELLETLSPKAILDLLPRLGYRRTEELIGRGFLFEATNGEQLAVPTNQAYRDYGSTILDILESLATPRAKLEDLVAMLVLPDCDIYRHKFDDDFAKWGSFPLDSFTEAIPALFDLLRYTAAGVYSQRRSYTRLPMPAELYEKSCRVGQTEQSSYVVKIFIPTNPVPTDAIQEQDEPFGRMVTRACIENLSFLREPEAEEYDAELPVAMNRNVASAIARLRPMSFNPTAAASFWFSARYSENTDFAQVVVDQNTFQRANAIEKRLAQQTGIERLSFRGYVVDLHKDRPQKVRSISHKITLDVQEGGGWRRLTLNLLPSQYRQAVRWHDMNRKVKIDALVDQRTKPWSATEIYDFDALDSNQIDLFDDPDPTL